MGCCASAPAKEQAQQRSKESQKVCEKPVWDSNGLAREELEAQRQEFWDTQPAYGGSPEIWSVLKAMCEAPDIETGKIFLEAAEVTIVKPDMTAFYDSRGFLYELPNYIVSDPRDWK